MSEAPPPISILDARLADIDRRLATIQTDLVPGESDSATAPSAPPPPEPAQLIAELRELTGAHQQLLDSMRELVAAYERALAAPAPPVRELSLSAGPLRSTEELRGFERTLSQIPEVRGVEIRGYEGGDRAIVDVHLLDATS